MRVLHGHAQRVDALVAEDAPAFGHESVALASEILRGVARRRLADGAEIVGAIAGGGFPVDPAEVRVAIGLDLAADLVGSGGPIRPVRPVRVVVRKQPPPVGSGAVQLEGAHLVGVERHELDISNRRVRALHRARCVARRHAPVDLAELELPIRQVRHRPEQLRELLAVGGVRGPAALHLGNLENREGRVAAETHRQPNGGVGKHIRADRDSVPAARVEPVADRRRVGFRTGQQHHPGEIAGGVGYRPPAAPGGCGANRIGGLAAVQVAAICRRRLEPAVRESVPEHVSHLRILRCAARPHRGLAKVTTAEWASTWVPDAPGRDSRGRESGCCRQSE